MREKGRNQNYPIDLTQTELEAIVKRGQQPAWMRRHAQTLLWSNAGKSDLEIAELHGVTPLTVATTGENWVKEKRISDKPKPGREKKLDGKQEAFLVVLACSNAPDGRENWTMQLLADRLVELQVIDEPISDETVRRTLKKMNDNPGVSNRGAWKMGWICMQNPSKHGDQWCVSMNAPFNCSGIPENHYQ